MVLLGGAFLGVPEGSADRNESRKHGHGDKGDRGQDCATSAQS